jgi:hypothetical protein
MLYVSYHLRYLIYRINEHWVLKKDAHSSPCNFVREGQTVSRNRRVIRHSIVLSTTLGVTMTTSTENNKQHIVSFPCLCVVITTIHFDWSIAPFFPSISLFKSISSSKGFSWTKQECDPKLIFKRLLNFLFQKLNFCFHHSRQQRQQRQQLQDQQGPLTDHRMKVMIQNQAFQMTLLFHRIVPKAGIQHLLPKYSFLFVPTYIMIPCHICTHVYLYILLCTVETFCKSYGWSESIAASNKTEISTETSQLGISNTNQEYYYYAAQIDFCDRALSRW